MKEALMSSELRPQKPPKPRRAASSKGDSQNAQPGARERQGRRGRSTSRETPAGSERLDDRIRTAIEKSVNTSGERIIDSIRHEVRAHIGKGIRDAFRQEIRAELAHEVKAEIKAELRREMKVRLSSIAEERTQLDPAVLLESFIRQVSDVLEKSGGEHAEALTQQQLLSVIRQAVLDALRSRKLHLSHLAELERMVKDGTLEQVPQLLPEWFVRAGLERVDDPTAHPERFAVINEGHDGQFVQVVQSAYIDQMTGQTIRPGQLRRTTTPQLQETAVIDTVSGE